MGSERAIVSNIKIQKKKLDYQKIGEELETLIEEKRPFQVEEEYEDA